MDYPGTLSQVVERFVREVLSGAPEALAPSRLSDEWLATLMSETPAYAARHGDYPCLTLAVSHYYPSVNIRAWDMRERFESYVQGLNAEVARRR